MIDFLSFHYLPLQRLFGSQNNGIFKAHHNAKQTYSSLLKASIFWNKIFEELATLLLA